MQTTYLFGRSEQRFLVHREGLAQGQGQGKRAVVATAMTIT